MHFDSSKIQAGLLTSGSSNRLRLPDLKEASGIIVIIVPGYSGGPVPELHRVPYYALSKAPEYIRHQLTQVVVECNIFLLCTCVYILLP